MPQWNIPTDERLSFLPLYGNPFYRISRTLWKLFNIIQSSFQIDPNSILFNIIQYYSIVSLVLALASAVRTAVSGYLGSPLEELNRSEEANEETNWIMTASSLLGFGNFRKYPQVLTKHSANIDVLIFWKWKNEERDSGEEGTADRVREGRTQEYAGGTIQLPSTV